MPGRSMRGAWQQKKYVKKNNIFYLKKYKNFVFTIKFISFEDRYYYLIRKTQTNNLCK